VTRDAAESPSSLTDRLLRRCTFPPAGSPVHVAVSGGRDSLALLVLASAARLDVTAVHVDHGVRPDSADEAALVEGVARRFGAAFEAVRVVVDDGPNLEARARDARYRALPPDVLTGHTLDDQAETILLFLMRGTGPEGLAGIDRARRPLLSLRRAETGQLCADLGLAVFDDPSNTDPRFRRNRVRAELLPLLDDIAGRDVAPLLARTADLQRSLLEVVVAAAADVDPSDAREVASLSVGVASEALRGWWRRETGEHYAPDADAVERMLGVARGDATAADVGGGWRIARTGQRLRLEQVLGGVGQPR